MQQNTPFSVNQLSNFRMFCVQYCYQYYFLLQGLVDVLLQTPFPNKRIELFSSLCGITDGECWYVHNYTEVALFHFNLLKYVTF